MSEDSRASGESEAHYRALFEASSSALVEEDFSQVKIAVDKLRSRGIGDLDAYFKEQPGELAAYTGLIRILKYNSEFVRYVNQSGDEKVESSAQSYIPKEAMDVFRGEIVALASGQSPFEMSFPNFIAGSRIKYLRMRLAIVPGNEDDWSSVLISFNDLTAEVSARDELAALVQQKDVLMRELEHRVKNNLNIISSLLSLESARIEGNEERRILLDAQSRIKSIALIYDLLSRSALGATLDCKAYLQSLAYLLKETYAADRKDIGFELSLDDLEIDVKRGVSLGLVVTELLTNAFKYAFPQRGGKVELGLAVEGDTIGLTVADDGIGAGEGVDLESSESLGFQIIDMLVKQMKGAIAIVTSPGFRVDIRIPLAA
jgi:two-component sensor histidine kinase